MDFHMSDCVFKEPTLRIYYYKGLLSVVSPFPNLVDTSDGEED